MTRLYFCGKVALRPSGQEVSIGLMGESPNDSWIVHPSGGDAASPMSTFCRYYDRDAPDRWYLSASLTGAFFTTYPTSSNLLLVAGAAEPKEAFRLEPNDDGTAYLVHGSKKAHLAVGMSPGIRGAHVAIPNSIPRDPLRFTVVPVTPGWDEIHSYVEWVDADLQRVDFSGMKDLLDHSGLNLSGANLSSTDFSGVDLSSFVLGPRPSLAGAKLVGAILDGLDLSGANLDGADLTGASLQRVDLTNASMVGTNFRNANLTGAKLDQQPRFSTDPEPRTIFAGATLTASQTLPMFKDWSYLDMRQMNLRSDDGGPLDLSGLIAEDTLLNGVDLGGHDLSGAQLTRCAMPNVSLASAKLMGASLAGCDMTGAVLDEADLSQSTLKEVKLHGASLASAKLIEATLDGCDMTEAMMNQANLSRSSLQNVILHKATLTSAKLMGANCRGAQLGATNKVLSLPAEQRALLSGGEPSAALREAFVAHGVALAESAHLTVHSPERSWLLTSDEVRYRLVLDSRGAIGVYQDLEIEHAAVLSGAHMADASFTDANLFAVNMSGAHWYGSRASADHAILEQIDGSNANFGSINLEKAELGGATLSNAILANARLVGARLNMSAAGKAFSLVQATVVGADFTDADLSDAILHNAAVSITAQAEGASVHGVPLFRMSTELAADLDAGRLSDEVKAACQESGYPLAGDAKIKAEKVGLHWEITNGSGEAEQVGCGYGTFSILRQTGALHVYGSKIWINRVGQDGNLETISFRYEATKLSDEALSDSTTCPNGKPWKSNKSGGETWEDAMTAADRPPTPPECIPSPESWCFGSR